ncbi:hypothetical protein, partial [Streptomyces parvus]|uniref:hypothetical protein n=1 Tax=Streptomyces parvus TaxID=66428 RepID=UPI0019412954
VYFLAIALSIDCTDTFSKAVTSNAPSPLKSIGLQKSTTDLFLPQSINQKICPNHSSHPMQRQQLPTKKLSVKPWGCQSWEPFTA